MRCFARSEQDGRVQEGQGRVVSNTLQKCGRCMIFVLTGFVRVSQSMVLLTLKVCNNVAGYDGCKDGKVVQVVANCGHCEERVVVALHDKVMHIKSL